MFLNHYTFCPGAEGNKTTTTLTVEKWNRNGTEVEAGEFEGVVYEQVLTSGRFSPSKNHPPFINADAPKAILDLALAIAAKDWRCDPSISPDASLQPSFNRAGFITGSGY